MLICTSSTCDPDDHFFLVELIDVEKSSAELLDESSVKEYLAAVAPIPYATGFIFKSKIAEFARSNGFSIDEYQVFVNGERLFKPYTTIKTINFAKQLCKNQDEVMVGGIMASILADRVEAATGIKPHIGTLHTPGELDDGNDMIIDTLPLDYSILEEIDYQYPASNAYFAYMTRGCVNKCKFCAVPKLEPVYTEYLPVSEQVRIASARYGEKKDLLLLDNNVLASCRFNDIIDDIKAAGFSLESRHTDPNLYEIAIQNLRDGHNDRGYIKACVRQFHALIDKRGTEQAPKGRLAEAASSFARHLEQMMVSFLSYSICRRR